MSITIPAQIDGRKVIGESAVGYQLELNEADKRLIAAPKEMLSGDALYKRVLGL